MIEDKRNFTHVKDMVRAYWMAVECCEPGKLYLVGYEDKKMIFTFREAVEKLIGMAKIDGIVHRVEHKYVRPTNVPYLIADVSEFINQTGWTPVIDFETILSDTLNYWRQRVRLEATA